MAVTPEQLRSVIDKIKKKESNLYFYAEDAQQFDESVLFVYQHVAMLIELGYNATIVHSTDGFVPDWVNEYMSFDKIPVKYFAAGEFDIRIEDFFFAPEFATKLMESISSAPCKNVIVVGNWFKILQALEPGVYWDTYNIRTAISLGIETSDYVKAIMPFASVATLTHPIDDPVFHKPESMTSKKMTVAFSSSRDGGNKSSNAIKTFYALYPYLRFVQFINISGMEKEARAAVMQDATWFATFDEFATHPIHQVEAIKCGCLLVGWDGLNCTTTINSKTAVVVPNGDVFRAGLAIGGVIEEYILNTTPTSRIEAAEEAASEYAISKGKEKNALIYEELLNTRIKELEELEERIKKGTSNA